MLQSPQFPQRRTTRLPGFDYSWAGAYFVTLVSDRRQCLFGTVENNVLSPNGIGRIVDEEWNAAPSVRREIELGPHVLMPNHLHALVVIKSGALDSANVLAESDDSRPIRGPKKRSISALIAGFKAATTRRSRISGLLAPSDSLWQRGFYDHVVRNEDDWHSIEQYIADNPGRWTADRERPSDVEWAHRTLQQSSQP